MTNPDHVPIGSKGRRRGGPLRIDRNKIVEAAREFDPQTMTMQAVADALGVDRKALNYHVTDRKGLLELVAADVFEEYFADAFHTYLARTRSSDPWQHALRAWSHAARDGMVATGRLTNYYVITSTNPAVFEPAESVLKSLRAAGFDSTTASRALIFATTFSMGVGRDMVLQRQLGEHPQGPEVRRLLDTTVDEERFEQLKVMIAANINGPDDIDTQFDFEIDVFIAGMKGLLEKR